MGLVVAAGLYSVEASTTKWMIAAMSSRRAVLLRLLRNRRQVERKSGGLCW